MQHFSSSRYLDAVLSTEQGRVEPCLDVTAMHSITVLEL